jgi:hypothetical protein
MLFAAPARAKSAMLPGLRIVQYSQGDGPMTILVCDRGARISWARLPFVCCCCAPQYEGIIFNTHRRKKIIMDPEMWVHYSPHLPDGKSVLTPLTVKEEFWQGKPALRDSFKVSVGAAMKERYEMLFQQGSDRSNDYDQVQVVYSRWIKLEPHVLRFLTGYYRFPGMKALPLEAVNHYPSGRVDKILQTLKIEPASIDPVDLIPPAGVNPTRDREFVTEDDLRVPAMRGLVEDLFGDVKKGKKH